MKIGVYDIEPIECIDLIDDCNWGEWSCNVTLPDGRFIENASVQGDGSDFAIETLRDENGKIL